MKCVEYFFLEDETILKNKTYINLPKNIVYFLINKNEIVYVGHTTRGLYRLFEHYNQGKIFDSYYFIEIPNGYQIRRIEEHYIKKIKPMYNILNK